MDDVTAAKRMCDAWFSEALDDESIPDLDKPAAIKVASRLDVDVYEGRVRYLQREQERLNSDVDRLRKDRVRVSGSTLHEEEMAAVARTNYQDKKGTETHFIKTKKQVNEELSQTGLHLLEHSNSFELPTETGRPEASADILRIIQEHIV